MIFMFFVHMQGFIPCSRGILVMLEHRARAFDSSQRALSITKNPVKHFLHCGCCSTKTTAALTETTPSQIFVGETQGRTQSRASHALISAKTPAKTPTSPHPKSNRRSHSTIQFLGLKATTTLDDIDKNLRS